MDDIFFTVVIPAFNCSQTIERVLESLNNQKYNSYEVIVVDDGSTDRTSQLIKKFPSVSYVFQNNAGPAAARNYGASLAKGNVVVFTDSDCIPQSDWLEKLSLGFVNKSVAAVCGSYGIANPQSILARCVHKEILYRHQTRLPDFPRAFGSYNVAILKQVFEELKGFDVTYRNASGEDNDLSYRLLNQNYKIYFQRDAFVDHFHPESLGRYLQEQFRHGFWRVKMYQDHPGQMRGDDYTFWKDSLEVGLSGVIFLMLILIFILKDFAVISLVCLIFFLFVLEGVFAQLTCRNVFETIYFTWAQFFRSFSRAAGFSSGVLKFSLFSCLKKR